MFGGYMLIEVRGVAAIGFVLCAAASLGGQTPEAAPRFGDVQIFNSLPNSMAEMRARFFGGRYELRNATLVDLIRTAWAVRADNIVGGPDWLDLNRFDVTATAPANVTPELLRSMLRDLLKDRFQLAVRNSSIDVPAYAITAGKSPRMEKADGPEAGGCAMAPASRRAPRGVPVTYVCSNMSVAALAAALPQIREASGYVFQYPVLDRAGIEGRWNFRLTWSPRNVYLPAVKGPGGSGAGETITLFDAFEKQLGLKLSMVKTPMPVLVVDNAVLPEVRESPRRRFEFEVAEIRPEDPAHPMPGCSSVNVQPGGRVRIHMTLKGLIGEAWGDISPDRIVGGKALTNPQCWEVIAKAPVPQGEPQGWNGPVWNGLDIDSMRQMLRSLLIDRFELEAHTQERPLNGYLLLADKPKLRRAEHPGRPGCREGPGDDGKDPRIQNPAASRLVTCRNMTINEFVAEMNKDLFRSRPLVNGTGLESRYDITFNFSPGSLFTGISPLGNVESGASVPDGAITLTDAFRRQLGLKLESRMVMAPALVIDRVNETPAEN